MPKQGEKAICNECRHFEPAGAEGSECHLHPPTVVVQNTEVPGSTAVINTAFPNVNSDNWCSDWR